VLSEFLDKGATGVDDNRTTGEREDLAVNQVLAQYDAPAFARRAQRVQRLFEQLLATCRKQREEWLDMVRTRLGLLHALAGGWGAVRPLLTDDAQLEALRNLHTALAPQLRAIVEPTASVRTLRQALTGLNESIERFNRRWQEFLDQVDLAPLNAARDGYNRYYLLEKECVVRSPHLARQGFQRLEPLTRAELAALLPPLAVPRLGPPHAPSDVAVRGDLPPHAG
jgi:hypothetical protein